ncbi:putative AC transposase [Neolecta irregularis DAH-3]|uniref:Putative AC transposase n=1 Tax=Neolecta irregularis (strain DAH-3) TaxID=1198029 RepID=A0A1U7LMA4_NEOID|nr:putative AC transposase [Neolecta irregularis DAH-3]|eukprot:OLL23796.1 putative AC transposase [Neolecta irregularis DAH-3]
MWTAPTHTGYQAIVAHFVDSNKKKITKALLALPEHKGSHGGEQQAKAFMDVVDDYGLRSKLGYFVSDNHPSNDKMLRHIAEEIPGFNPINRRIRCNGHIINLVATAFLFATDKTSVKAAMEYTKNLALDEQSEKKPKEETANEWRKMGPLGQLHNLIVHIRSSTQRYNTFKALTGRSIPLDNDTRWNSWWLELHISLSKRKELMSYSDDYYDELKHDFLNREKWEELQEIHDCLQPFYDITIDTQGDQSTIDQILTDMDFLVTHLKQMEQHYRLTNNSTLLQRVMNSWYLFDKYYDLTDDSPAYAAAILLHPSLRKSYLDKKWSHQAQYIPSTIENVRKLWKKEYKMERVVQTEEVNASKFQNWRKEIYEDDIVDEYQNFINAPRHKIVGTALDWWLEPTQQAMYPNLSHMAMDIFSIPPMSVEAERIFAGARRTMSWTRCTLGGRMVEQTECLKSWVREQLSDGIFKTVGEVEEAADTAVEQLSTNEISARSRYTPEGSPEPYTDD